MSYGMLFVIGLVTSVHCVAMCGGINLSQCIPKSEDGGKSGKTSGTDAQLPLQSGKGMSYTVVGFIVGALGPSSRFPTLPRGSSN